MNNIQNSYCIKKCQFLSMDEEVNDFVCVYFNEKLKISMSPSKSSLRPLRCNECNAAGNMINHKMAHDIIKHHLQVIQGNITYLQDMMAELEHDDKDD